MGKYISGSNKKLTGSCYLTAETLDLKDSLLDKDRVTFLVVDATTFLEFECSKEVFFTVILYLNF